MNFTPISQLTQSNAYNPGAQAVGDPNLDRNDFLLLLVAQLQNQDPLNPADPQEFASQLAQFSSLEQMININNTMQTVAMLQASMNNAQAASLIGHEIKANGNSVAVTDGGVTPLRFHLGDDAQNVKIEIRDAEGKIVRAILGAGPLREGEQDYQWDGLDDAGATVANGNYTFEVTATTAQGDPVTVNTFTTGIVDGVIFDGGLTYLDVGGQLISLGDIIEIHRKGEGMTNTA